jgi:predicted nucleotidyltransferase
MQGLNKDILSTIAYADVMGLALTPFEVWKYLMATNREEEHQVCVRLGAVMEALQTEELQQRVVILRGVCVLRGRERLTETRWPREYRSLRAIKRARRLARILRAVPFVRMVALTGSVALKNARRGSDWDLLISLRAGHIWMGRVLVTGVLQLLGKRRHGRYTHDRACLNYWITSRSLEITLKDWFASQEYMTLIPLFGVSEYQHFRWQNRWIGRFRPQYTLTRLVPRWCLMDTRLARAMRDMGEILLGDPWLERWVGRLQQAKIAANPKTHVPGSLVSADDQALIFLPRPQGPKIFERFKQRLSEIEGRA